MAKRNRRPLPESPIFGPRGTDVKWPTLRGAYLDPQNIRKLRQMAHGVIFLEGPYNTRLNFGKSPEDSKEQAVFFEHLKKVDGDWLFLLCWIGNFHNGSIFHCAWQFPQHLHWPQEKLEVSAFLTYKRVAGIMYNDPPLKKDHVDEEVKTFCKPRR